MIMIINKYMIAIKMEVQKELTVVKVLKVLHNLHLVMKMTIYKESLKILIMVCVMMHLISILLDQMILATLLAVLKNLNLISHLMIFWMMLTLNHMCINISKATMKTNIITVKSKTFPITSTLKYGGCNSMRSMTLCTYSKPKLKI